MKIWNDSSSSLMSLLLDHHSRPSNSALGWSTGLCLSSSTTQRVGTSSLNYACTRSHTWMRFKQPAHGYSATCPLQSSSTRVPGIKSWKTWSRWSKRRHTPIVIQSHHSLKTSVSTSTSRVPSRNFENAKQSSWTIFSLSPVLKNSLRIRDSWSLRPFAGFISAFQSQCWLKNWTWPLKKLKGGLSTSSGMQSWMQRSILSLAMLLWGCKSHRPINS